jgi:phospholipid/cholesterol/gamma-HCH transport system substrate-binding protein
LTVNEIPGASPAQAEEAVPEQAGKREVRIGIFVIAGLIATVYLLFLLTDPAMFRGRYTVMTTVDNAMGLRKGDPVQMRGVTIGSVNDFEMGGRGEDVVIVLEVDGQWDIPEGSSTQLVTPGLMAPKTVEILPGPGPGTIGRGGTMPGIAVRGLLDDTETLGEKGQIALDRIAELLSPKNLDALGGSAEGLNTLMGELSDLVESESENLTELIQSFNRAADGLAEITSGGEELGEDLASAVAQADSLMGRLKATSESLGSATASLETILARIADGEGTLGQLSVNDTLFTNLAAAVESARLLMDDLRENPGRYMPGLSIF